MVVPSVDPISSGNVNQMIVEDKVLEFATVCVQVQASPSLFSEVGNHIEISP